MSNEKYDSINLLSNAIQLGTNVIVNNLGTEISTTYQGELVKEGDVARLISAKINNKLNQLCAKQGGDL